MVEYKQGMCHLLAPFLILFGDCKQPATVWKCLDSTIERLLPSVFNDGNFENLRCTLYSVVD